jgi:hypothetical protein
MTRCTKLLFQVYEDSPRDLTPAQKEDLAKWVTIAFDQIAVAEGQPELRVYCEPTLVDPDDAEHKMHGYCDLLNSDPFKPYTPSIHISIVVRGDKLDLRFMHKVFLHELAHILDQKAYNKATWSADKPKEKYQAHGESWRQKFLELQDKYSFGLLYPPYTAEVSGPLPAGSRWIDG